MTRYQRKEEDNQVEPLDACITCGCFGEDGRGNYCKGECSPVDGVTFLGGPKFIKFMFRVIEDIDVNTQKPDWCPAKVRKE